MKIEDWPISKIIPYARNPRKNDNAVAGVAGSIKEFGFRQPVVVDSDGVIIVGHTRVAAARQLGLTVVPVHVADSLTESQKKAYRLADNRSGENAEWDQDLLALEIGDPFVGSGTTIIAAEQTGRSCYAMEISPQYCDVAVRRWEAFTGEKAILESTGKTFEEVSGGSRSQTEANAA